MNILIACEESQRICIEFRKLGFNAFSCDIIDCSGGHPEWHIKSDCLPLINTTDFNFITQNGDIHIIYKWDLIIAHPPCTDLCVSGARWFKEKQADGRQQKSIDFFMQFTDLNCDHVAIENPIGIMSTHYRKPDQIIQPYMFGDPVRKTTCLWLKNLPKLLPTDIVDPKIINDGKTTYSGPAYYATNENGKILAWNNPETAKIRSKTYHGIAKAIADQWGRYLLKVGDKDDA